MEFLLALGLEVNAVSSSEAIEGIALVHTGETPLHVAALKNHKEIVELLLKHGADIDASSAYHLTRLHVAEKAGFTDICKILMGYMAAVPEEDEITASRQRLRGALLAFKRLDRFPRKIIEQILISIGDLRTDAAYVLLKKIKDGHVIDPNSLIAKREIRDQAAQYIFDAYEPLLSIYMFVRINKDEVFECIRAGIDDRIEEPVRKKQEEPAGFGCICM